ncbi:phage anti-repressor protein [Salirhabdus euzebyi]|uniref:Phage anti-repressor protein n=1 Tax=Salirhabdus euzebyi TaxID=394506 RepID=A0A841PX80_9BACI|nr:antA/AntB antirepressor family protein [Salirhabdus euzebyi]MBB6452016.1 phage anti-repressor protein [Salirhabdus euzebyi]
MNLKTIANDILPVYENNSGLKFVDARELHEQLFVGKDFSSWIKDRIEKYGFTENEDYKLTLTKIGERQNVTRHDYLLTLDTAKEIAMVQNNEAGRVIRKYFIQVEKQFRQQQPKTQLEVLQGTINQMIEQESRINQIALHNQQLAQENKSLKQRMDNFDRIDTIGDLQQRLNKIIKRYAWDNGVNIGTAWKQFDQAFNTAFRTNITAKRNNYAEKHCLKSLTRPQYLSLVGQLEDGIRVADKLLNQSRSGGYVYEQ